MHKHIAVVGATGAVGREVLHCLEKSLLSIEKLSLFASARSAGKVLDTFMGPVEVRDVSNADFSDIDLAIFSAGKAVSLEYAPKALKSGCCVVDNTSAFRLTDGVALVVPEVNAEKIGERAAIIANPNCSTIQLVLALKAIRDCAGLEEVRVTTFQSCSGAGQKGIDALFDETRQALEGHFPEKSAVHARSIAFDVVPQIGTFAPNGYSEEEMKMILETRKILELDDLRLSATCVRVPVITGHSEAVNVVTKKETTVQALYKALSEIDSLVVTDREDMSAYPTARQCAGYCETFMGRLREDSAGIKGRAFVFWIVSDNLLKGAAWNAVQVAECYMGARTGS